MFEAMIRKSIRKSELLRNLPILLSEGAVTASVFGPEGVRGPLMIKKKHSYGSSVDTNLDGMKILVRRFGWKKAFVCLKPPSKNRSSQESRKVGTQRQAGAFNLQ